MPDAEFEKTFADLAHARLRDRAPGLLDYMVGFQLLDKSDDDTHAVGVWGFKVGPEWMYGPVFFLNGQLKGDELLYVKSQDSFVPLKENWINYLLNRRPHVLGETEPLEQGQLGLQQPDFDSIARPPYTGSKLASAGQLRTLVDYLSDRVSSDFRDFLPVVLSSPSGEKRAELTSKWHLPNFIKSAGKSAAYALLNTMRKDAAFGDAVLKFYKMEDILEAAQQAFAKGALEKQAADGDKKIEGTAPTVRVMFADRANVLDLDDVMLTDAEKEKLQSDRYVVQDKRDDDNVSVVYNKTVGKTLQNPSEGGYCPVLTASGFQPHLLIVNPIGDQGYDKSGRGDAIAINMDKGNRIRMLPVKGIYINNEPHDSEAWQTKFNGLPSGSSCREKDKVIFVNEKCEGTVPFFIKRKVVSDDGRTMLYGEFDRYPQARGKIDSNEKMLFPKYTGRVFNVSDAEENRYGCYATSVGGSDDTCMIVTGKDGNKVTQIDGTYFVPNGCKAIKVNPKDITTWLVRDYDRKKNPSKDVIDYPDPEIEDRDPDALASPQTLADIEMQIFKSSSAVTLQPVSDGIGYWLKIDGVMSRPMRKLAALKELIERHQLREKDALMLLKQASMSPPEYIIKYAQGEGQPFAAPAIPEAQLSTDPDLMSGVATQYPQTDILTVGSDVSPRNPSELDMDATYQAQQAAQQGQKEVMDTSVVAGLVKTMDVDAAVDNYIGDLMLGLDRLGRILFMYYWHYEKFKDRYGAQDMPELEDNLRNTFDSMGDLTLFLKQKTIEPEVSGATAEAELTEVL